VNLDDIGTLDSKYNSRQGGLSKLISTYNNGNQYGVATLLLLPLFDAFEHSRFRKLVVRAALVLTDPLSHNLDRINPQSGIRHRQVSAAGFEVF